MKVKLQQTSVWFAVQEVEAQSLINKAKEESTGDIVKQQIDMKNHKDYGEYYEVTIKEEFTTSRSVLENGY
ncbi:MAG TPA: hypothetical protein VFC64_01880 [Atopostipes sp.]|nr:hypothetical protein [Atopostipes sp.]